MLRLSVLLASVVLAGCATYTERSYPDTAGAAIGAALGSNSAGGAVGALVDAVAEKHPPVVVVRVRPKDLMAKLGLGPKSKFAPVYESWLKGIGVPLQAVEELTIVWAGEETRSVHIVASADVDRKAIEKACKGLSLQFQTARSFACSRGFNPQLPGRIRKQLGSVGKHDVVVWADASLVAEMDGLPALVKNGFRDGTLAIDVGDEVEAAARLNFKDEATALKGAKAATALLKMARMGVLMMTAQLDVVDAFPEAIEGACNDELKAMKAYFGLVKNVEPGLLACKAVPRGKMVPLYVRAEMSVKKLDELLALMDDKGSIKREEPSPGIFFSPTVTQTKAEVPVPTRARVPAPTEPLPPTTPPMAAVPRPAPTTLPPPAPQPPMVARTPAPLVTPLAPPTPALPPPLPPAVTPPPAGPAGYNATPTVPALPPRPAAPPTRRSMLSVANVHKEDVSIFAIDVTGLRFVHHVSAGDAVELPVLPGQRLAATFSRAPYCANFTPTGNPGEVWLLRPAPGSPPTAGCGPAACAPVITAR